MIKLKRFFVHVFACFLIPAYTLLFAGSMRWFGTNFSVIAVTGPDHYRGFIYWGVLAGGYFLVMLNALAAVLPGWRAGCWPPPPASVWPTPWPSLICQSIFQNMPPSMCCWPRPPACC